jgi:hypothetical protein
MLKISKKPIKNTGAEILSISKEGLWLNVSGKKHFLPHHSFPWFKAAPVEQVLNVTLPAKDHLCWPDLDIDLHLDGIEHPEKYPVIFDQPKRNRPKEAAHA